MKVSLLDPLAPFRGGRVLIDTNLLLLLAVGLADSLWIQQHKRSCQFTAEHYAILAKLLRSYRLNLCTTPHVLAEASNHLHQPSTETGKRIFEVFSGLIRKSIEIFEPALPLMGEPTFYAFGLTDAITISLADGHPMAVFTEDRPLLGFLRNRGLPVFSVDEIYRLKAILE